MTGDDEKRTAIERIAPCVRIWIVLAAAGWAVLSMIVFVFSLGKEPEPFGAPANFKSVEAANKALQLAPDIEFPSWSDCAQLTEEGEVEYFGIADITDDGTVRGCDQREGPK